MMHPGRLVGLALTLLLLGHVSARACSPAPGFIRPSNFELVQDADVIVIATPINERGVPADPYKDVSFRTLQTIKGEVPETFEVGQLMLGRTRPSDPNQIMFSHPEGHMGPCNRMTLARGKSYVLFLARDRAGKLEIYGAPFSRVNEDFAGPDSLWMKTIRIYLDLQQRLKPMAQLDELSAIRAKLPTKPRGKTFKDALANDIDMHFASISPWKPTGFLLAALSDYRSGKPPKYRPRPDAFDEEQSAAEALTEVLFPEAANSGPEKGFAQEILTSLAAPGHPDAWPVFEPLVDPAASPTALSLGLRYLVNHDRYGEAYALIEARAPAIMAAAPQPQAAILARAISDVQEDPAYEGALARWRNDPTAAARWPALALKLHDIERKRFGWDDHYGDGLLTIIAGDWRANPELTYGLSGHYDEIGEWAVRELDTVTRQASTLKAAAGDELTLPLSITVRWLGHRDEEEFSVLSRIFCGGSLGRATVLRAWGDYGGFMGLERFVQFAASPTMAAEDRVFLAATADVYEVRRRREKKGELFEEEAMWIGLFKRGLPLSANDLGKIQPVSCAS